MGWVDPGIVEARVRRLDSDGLAAFVTDLWTARGFETTRDGAYITAQRGGKTQVLYVLAGRATPPAAETIREVDTVVAARRPHRGETLAAELAARHVDASDLVAMLRYAIERDVAAALCERRFGAPPDELQYPATVRVRRAIGDVEIKTVAAVVVVFVLVGAGTGAVFGLAGPGLGGTGTPDDAAVASEPSATVGSDAPATATPEDGSSSTETGATDPVRAPGVSESGISNASRLAQAHAGVVSDTTSYTIWFDFYAPTNESGSPGRVQYDVDVRVQDEESSVRTSLERTAGNRSLLRTVYFDGTNRYVAVNGSPEFTQIDTREPTATPRAVPFTAPAGMVRTYLATPESSMDASWSTAVGKRYRLHGTGRPAALPDTVSDYEMTAIVDERGFVWMFEAEFAITRDGDGVGDRERVRLTWTYDRLNTTEVRVTP